jgi:hypothetical protein
LNPYKIKCHIIKNEMLNKHKDMSKVVFLKPELPHFHE